MSRSRWSVILLAMLFVAPPATVDAAPRSDEGARSPDGSRSSETRTRSQKRHKRARRRGLRVLNSRDTPGRTVRTTKPPPKVHGVQLIDPDAMMALLDAMPADHVEIGAAKMADGNVTASAWGHVTASTHYGPLGMIFTEGLSFLYPIVGAGGRDLVIECTGDFKSDLKISTVTFNHNVPITWDELTVSASKSKPKTKFKVLVDTTHPTKGKPYTINVTSSEMMRVYKCTLDLKN